jgi:hemoglobin/transferrin/lactoferrin receptor protein
MVVAWAGPAGAEQPPPYGEQPPPYGEQPPLAGEEEPQEPPAEDEAPSPTDVDAPAVTEPLSYRFDEVVVTASRLPESGFDLPYAVETVPEQRLRERRYRTTPEALRDVPGVMVQKTTHGHGSPYIRGFTSFRNLFLVDGIRLNNSVFRPGPNQYWNTVDPLAVQRYEIVKGPGSVLYGSDAVGGTVNAVTRGPEGYGDGPGFGGRLSYRFSEAERSHVGRIEAYGTAGRTFGIYAGASGKDFGSLEGGRDVGTQHDTGYEEWDADFKMEYFFDPDTRLVVAHQSVRQLEVPRTHKTIRGITWEGLTRGDELVRDLWQERDLTYVQLHAGNREGFVEAVRLSVSWQEQRERRERFRTGGRFDEQSFIAGTLGASAQFESPTPIGRLVYGVDYYHDNVNSASTGNPIQGPVGDDASYDLLGVFLQDTIPLHERLELTLGGRYEYARAEADEVSDPVTGRQISVSEDWDALVGSGRLLYQLDRAGHWNVYGGVSQAFRAPNLSDLTRFDSARTDEFETPAPGLDPERYLSYEGGVKASYEDASLQLSYFYTDVRDMILRFPTGRVVDGDAEVTKSNVGDGFVHGVELGGSLRFHPQLTAFGTLSWLDGEVDTFPTSAAVKEREPLSRLMPTQGYVGLRWDHPDRRLWAEVTGTFAEKQDDLSTRDEADTSRIPPGGTPDYCVLSLRTGYRVHENVDLTLALENVTDEDYRIHGSGVNEPGRNLVVGVEVRF